MIVIGASLGGMKAMRVILPLLPRTFPGTLAAVLHRHREADDSLIHLLRQESSLPVNEVVDKEPISPGRVYLAPPDYHLLVEPTNFSLSTDDPVQYARPSIDVLFESAADIFGSDVIALVLTGANQDGARGAARIQERGGLVLVQDPETAESPVMPKSALEATGIRQVYSLEKMVALLVELHSSATKKS
jgi:two-component system chemotaxis response regulator CheB